MGVPIGEVIGVIIGIAVGVVLGVCGGGDECSGIGAVHGAERRDSGLVVN